MKELIEYLRKSASNGLAGVQLSNAEALQIAAALETAMHPTAVTAALARLNYTQLDPVLKFAAIDKDSGFYAFDEMPVQSKYFRVVWHLPGVSEKNPSLRTRALEPFNFNSFDWEQMLFQRTADGWQWIGNPELKHETEEATDHKQHRRALIH